MWVAATARSWQHSVTVLVWDWICPKVGSGRVLSRGLEAHRGSPEQNPFAATDRRFDVVTMFHFLEHVPAPDTTLAHVRRMLKPEGELIVQVPNCASLQAQIFGRHWAGYDVPRHLVNYSTETLMALLQRSEFEVNQFTHQSIRDNPTALANSIAPGLYPPARVAKGVRVSVWQAWVRDLMYLALSTACIPPTFLEAACGLGSALMVKARVKT